MRSIQNNILLFTLLSAFIISISFWHCAKMINPIEPGDNQTPGSGLIPPQQLLLLWNRLGSLTEVQNSEKGPDGVLSGGYLFLPARFNNGLQLSNNRTCTFANACNSPNIGTIELWWRPSFDSTDTNAGIYCLVRMKKGKQVLNWTWQGLPTQQMNITFSTSGINICSYQFNPAFSAGSNIHLGASYNNTASGNNKIKFYRNNVQQSPVLVLMNSAWNFNTMDLTLKKTNSIYNGRIDNIKIYNYQKTTFSALE